MTTQTTERRPNAIVNRYDGKCVNCEVDVTAECGYAHKNENGKWLVECHECARNGRLYLPMREDETAISLGNREAVRVHKCAKCLDRVAWVRSARGSWYLSSVVWDHGAKAGIPPHKCR